MDAAECQPVADEMPVSSDELPFVRDEIPFIRDERFVRQFVADGQLRTKKRQFVAKYGISSRFCAFCQKILLF